MEMAVIGREHDIALCVNLNLKVDKLPCIKGALERIGRILWIRDKGAVVASPKPGAAREES